MDEVDEDREVRGVVERFDMGLADDARRNDAVVRVDAHLLRVRLIALVVCDPGPPPLNDTHLWLSVFRFMAFRCTTS